MTGQVGIVDQSSSPTGAGAAVTSSNALKVDPVSGTQPLPIIASYTDRGGTVAVGGTSQTLMAANTSRKAVVIQNPSTAAGQGIATAESLFINFTTAANATNHSSLELLPGGSYDSGGGPVTSELITVVAATTGHAYVAKEQ